MASGLGIDIGNDSIKIVRVSVSGGKVSVTGALKIPRRPTAESADAAGSDKAGAGAHVGLPADLGKQLKVAALPTSGTVGVTGRDVNLKYLSVPPVPPDKLRMLLGMELGGKVSGRGSLDEDVPAMTYDWRLLNIPAGLKSDLLVMAGVAKQDYLMSVNSAMKNAGISVETLTPSVFGLVNAYLRTHTPPPGETVVLCDVGHELLEIAILEEGSVYFARSAPGGGKKFNLALDKVLQTGPERAAIFKHERARIYPEGAELRSKQDENFQPALREGADVIAGAIRSSIMFCRTQAKLPKLDFNRVYLSGGGARVKGLCEYLEKKLSRPVQPLNMSANVNLGKLAPGAAQLFEGAISDMTVALGLAVIDSDPKSFHFKLTPEPILVQRTFWRKTMVGVAAGVVLLLSLVFPYLHSQKAAAESGNAVAGFRERSEAAVKEKKNYQKFVAEKKLLADRANYYAVQTRLPRVYPDLTLVVRTATPPNVMLNYLGPKLGGDNAQVGTGMGSWKAIEAPITDFEIRGSYSKDAYPDTQINAAWLRMRDKLLQVPGVVDAKFTAEADIDANSTQALAAIGKKPFFATIKIQNPREPLKGPRDTADTPKTK